ncbi:DivIVA domain-containing protein, partial [Macrococcoides caseolyticum]
MLAEKLKLTAKEILEKEFKTGFRGYKQEEVDKF